MPALGRVVVPRLVQIHLPHFLVGVVVVGQGG